MLLQETKQNQKHTTRKQKKNKEKLSNKHLKLRKVVLLFYITGGLRGVCMTQLINHIRSCKFKEKIIE